MPVRERIPLPPAFGLPIKVGAVYENRRTLRNAVEDWSIRGQWCFNTPNSEFNQVQYICNTQKQGIP